MAKEHALLRLLERYSGSGVRLLSLLEEINRPAPPGAGEQMAAAPLAFGVRTQAILERLGKGKGIHGDCWDNPCTGEIWCRQQATAQSLRQTVADLLSLSDVDTVLHGALLKLAEEAALAGHMVRRVVFHEVQFGQDVAGKPGDHLRRRLARLAREKRVFEVASRDRLRMLLAEESLDVGSFAHASDGLRREAVKRTADAVLMGKYAKDGRLFHLTLKLSLVGHMQSFGAGTVFLAAGIPKQFRLTAAEERARDGRVRQAAEEERRKADSRVRAEAEREAEQRQAAQAAEWERLRADEVAKSAAVIESFKAKAAAEAKARAGAEAAARGATEELRVQREVEARVRKERTQANEQQLAAATQAAEEAEAKRKAAEDVRRRQAAELEQLRAHVKQAQLTISEIRAEREQRKHDSYVSWINSGSADAPLSARLSIDRGCGATYPVGSQLEAYVSCNKDCYVKLFHKDSKGKVQLVYPNKFDPNNHLTAGSRHRIAGPGYPFQYDITEPLGVDTLILEASDRPFGDMDRVRQEYGATGALAAYGTKRGKALRQVLTRGLKVSAKVATTATGKLLDRDRCAFTVAPGGTQI